MQQPNSNRIREIECMANLYYMQFPLAHEGREEGGAGGPLWHMRPSYLFAPKRDYLSIFYGR